MKKVCNYLNKFNFISSKMTRYFFVAIIIVAVEMELFVFLNNILKVYYVIAIVLSFIVATILNWYFSKKFVFIVNGSDKIKKEIALIFLGSLVGVLLQVLISIICVEYFKLLPALGKIISMGITFFWNFWFRLKCVFN